MIGAIVSDFGGVLTTPLSEAFRGYQEESGVRPEDLGRAMAAAQEKYGEHPLFELERGEISEEEFGRRLQEGLPHEFDLDALRDVYFERLSPNTRMIEFMRQLGGRGLRMALCTNNVREWEPLWRAKLPQLDQIFDVVVDSAFVGSRKPEARIFEITLDRLGNGLRFENCLLVDDIQVNCDGATSLGMRAVRFEDTEQAIAAVEDMLAGRGAGS
ncbi:MAG TPA: HAD family phosphatase [Thermoleophilaceae bacterium]|jgi:putative hydrolase of the HAD superfamily